MESQPIQMLQGKHTLHEATYIDNDCVKRYKTNMPTEEVQVVYQNDPSRYSKVWTKDDDLLLYSCTLNTPEKEIDWAAVAMKIGKNCLPEECWSRWRHLQASHAIKVWSNVEDRLLVQAVQHYYEIDGVIDWNKVAEHCGGSKTNTQCKQRWDQNFVQQITNPYSTSSNDHFPIYSHPQPNQQAAAISLPQVPIKTPKINDTKQGGKGYGKYFKMKQWSSKEDDELLEAVLLYESKSSGGINWTKVSDHLGKKRHEHECNARWDELLKSRMNGNHNTGMWTKKEDKLLADAIENEENYRIINGEKRINWQSVSLYMKCLRSPQQCNQRWHGSLKPRVRGDMKIGPWTDEEDDLLVEAVCLFDGHGKSGTIDWNQVSYFMGKSRSPHQCNHRWHDCIRQSYLSKIENWTLEEDQSLAEAVVKLQAEGNDCDWKKIPELMNTKRSVIQCKYRWYNISKGGSSANSHQNNQKNRTDPNAQVPVSAAPKKARGTVFGETVNKDIVKQGAEKALKAVASKPDRKVKEEKQVLKQQPNDKRQLEASVVVDLERIKRLESKVCSEVYKNYKEFAIGSCPKVGHDWNEQSSSFGMHQPSYNPDASAEYSGYDNSHYYMQQYYYPSTNASYDANNYYDANYTQQQSDDTYSQWANGHYTNPYYQYYDCAASTDSASYPYPSAAYYQHQAAESYWKEEACQNKQ